LVRQVHRARPIIRKQEAAAPATGEVHAPGRIPDQPPCLPLPTQPGQLASHPAQAPVVQAHPAADLIAGTLAELAALAADAKAPGAVPPTLPRIPAAIASHPEVRAAVRAADLAIKDSVRRAANRVKTAEAAARKVEREEWHADHAADETAWKVRLKALGEEKSAALMRVRVLGNAALEERTVMVWNSVFATEWKTRRRAVHNRRERLAVASPEASGDRISQVIRYPEGFNRDSEGSWTAKPPWPVGSSALATSPGSSRHPAGA
jgi:hypothetical protein